MMKTGISFVKARRATMRRIYSKAYITKLFKHLKNRPLRIKPGHLYIFMASGKTIRTCYALWNRNDVIRFGQFNLDNETVTQIACIEPNSSSIKVGCSPLNFYGTLWYGKDYYSVHCFEDVSISDLDIETVWYYSNLSKPKYLGNFYAPKDEELAPIDYMN